MQTNVHVDKSTIRDYTLRGTAGAPFVTVEAHDGDSHAVLFFSDLDILDAHIAACREARNLLAAALPETQEVA
jgi:hypothetical protein